MDHQIRTDDCGGTSPQKENNHEESDEETDAGAAADEETASLLVVGAGSSEEEYEEEANNNNNNNNDSVVPPEILELHLVDMDNDRMDPFEWIIRKLIPIPKRYYWDTDVDPRLLPAKVRAWHRSIFVMAAIIQITDWVGMTLANCLGITTSRYDYVTSTMSDVDWEYSRRAVAERLGTPLPPPRRGEEATGISSAQEIDRS